MCQEDNERDLLCIAGLACSSKKVLSVCGPSTYDVTAKWYIFEQSDEWQNQGAASELTIHLRGWRQ